MSPDNVLDLLQKVAPTLSAERISLADASGRVLARRFIAPFDMPAFSRSAMDGFAVRGADVATASSSTPITLPVVGEVAAGDTGPAELPPWTTCRVATGGALPRGADTVLRQEDVRFLPGAGAPGALGTLGEIMVTRPVKVGRDVVEAGVYAREGELLLPAGQTLGANDVALLAAFGCEAVEVVRQPRVIYVETGDELVSPGEPLPEGHIYASNAVMLGARARAHGAAVVAERRVVDEPGRMALVFEQLLNEADVVISTGGVSVGARDFVADVLEQIGCKTLFRGVDVRPGHPLMAARRGAKLWIGLAGNPTAAFVTHEHFVRPLLWYMAGIRFAQGFNPVAFVEPDGPAVRAGRRTSLYMGRLQYAGGRETVRIDAERRPTALPGPFETNAVVRVDAQSDTSASEVERDEGRSEAGRRAGGFDGERDAGWDRRERGRVGHRGVEVYVADRVLAEARFVRFPWEVGGVLLAGGRSRRMGHSKLFLPVGGVPLVVRAYRALADVCARVRVVGASSEVVDLLVRWEGEAIREWCIPDDEPGGGPLAGLMSGLGHSQEPLTMCLAADMPFVDGNTLRPLLDAAAWRVETFGDAPGEQAYVLIDDERRQPLTALYPTERARAAARRVWHAGGRAMHQFVDALDVVDVPAPVGALTNVNTPADYRKARLERRGDGEAAEARRAVRAQEPAMIAFAGHSGSGKTTLISRLIPHIKARGWRVVVIKHGRGFELDKPGKDSWRFKEAGADGVLLVSDEEKAYMVRPEERPSFDELVGQVAGDADVIIVEGFKSLPIAKVAVLRPDEVWAEHPLFGDSSVQAVYGGVRPVAGRDAESEAAYDEAAVPSVGAVGGAAGGIPFFAGTALGDGDDPLIGWVLHRIALGPVDRAERGSGE